MRRYHPRRARTNPLRPEEWATSDRNGMVGQHKKLHWQFEWRGSALVNTRVLVYEDELDKPQRQLGSLILPPDPIPINNPRPEQYTIDEEISRVDADGVQRISMDGILRITSNQQD